MSGKISTFSILAFAAILAGAVASGGEAQARTVSIDFANGVSATVRGVYVTKDYWFDLSEDWDFNEPSVLDLRFSHTSILVRQQSTLTVMMNGAALQTIYLDSTNEKLASLLVKIPARVFKGGPNTLSIVIKMRSELKDLCDDVHNPGLWTLLEKESVLDVNYDEKRIVPDLAHFPSDYANPDLLHSKAKERVHAVIIVPSEPTPTELEAYGALATLFGQEIGLGLGEFRVMTRDKIDPAFLKDRHIVLVGGLEFIKEFTGGQWQLPVPTGEIAETEAGQLMEFASPFNPHRRLLVVTGRNDASMRLVAEHLKTPGSVRNLKGASVAFDKPPAFEVEPETKAEAAFVVRLQDMKMSDLMERGKFYHSLTFTLPNPFVGKVKDGAFIRIAMSHSDLLLPQSSSLLVKVNGEPVKSIRLTKDTAPRNTWDVKIPLQYLGSRWLTFEMELFMDIGDPDCYYNHPEMAWFTLHNDTFLYLPVDTASGETLANYPYMFLAWNRFDHLTAVFAEPVTNGSLTAVFNILTFLSQSLRAPTYVDLAVTTSKQLTPEQQKNNLLVVGPIGSLLADPTWSQVLPKELTTRAGTPGATDILNSAGFLALSKSPFDASRRVLAVGGRSDDEINLSAPYLYAPGSVEWVRGTLAIVLQDKELRVLLPPTQAEAVTQFDPTKVRFEERDGKMVPVLEMPRPAAAPSRNNVAYLVFFLLTPILVLLVVLRLRALSKEPRDGK